MTPYSVSEQEKLVAFGLRLKKHRLDKNLSQEELAALCELHRTYISSAERGERNISLINIYKIASALKISPMKLVTD